MCTGCGTSFMKRMKRHRCDLVHFHRTGDRTLVRKATDQLSYVLVCITGQSVRRGAAVGFGLIPTDEDEADPPTAAAEKMKLKSEKQSLELFLDREG